MTDQPTTFSWSNLNQWDLNVVPIALIFVAGILYIWSVRRVAQWPTYRLICFVLGLLVTFLAVCSVVAVYDSELFSDHMIQHLMLIMMAAPLFAASAPLDLARRAGPPFVDRFLNSSGMKVVLHPLFGFALYVVFIPATHLTSFFNLMLTSEFVHRSEHLAFLVIGYLFFRPAFGIEEGSKISPGLRLVYVMVAVPVDTFTGLALAMQTTNPYPAYAAANAGSAQDILNSIHLGGAIMWIGGDALMLLAMIPIAVIWVKDETRKTKELDAELDAAGL